MKILLITTCFTFHFFSYSNTNKNLTFKPTCNSAKEFITTYKYLKDEVEFLIKKSDLYNVAKKVSQGCDGSSDRFFKILKVLTKAKIDTKTAIEIGFEMSMRDEDYTQAFVEIFKKSFDSKYLDLDLLTSLNVSRSLALNYKGNIKHIKNDFNEFLLFCTKFNLNLSNQLCLSMTEEILISSQYFKSSIYKPFESLFSFLSHNKTGPKMTIKDSLKLAIELIKFGPKSYDNFKEVYLFLQKNNERALTTLELIKKSKEIAEYSYKKDEKN